MTAPSGYIFKIQGVSTYDGPGIRTALFFKGCPLRCQWCFNPESQRRAPEILHYAESGIGCGACSGVCPAGAVSPAPQGRRINHACAVYGCLLCAQHCPVNAMRIYGKHIDMEEVVQTCLKDVPFCRESGGVTLTGGEVLSQPEFAQALLESCKAYGLNPAMVTCGFGNSHEFARILSCIGHPPFDVQRIFPQFHPKYTGSDNAKILSNTRLAAAQHPDMVIYIPLIPGATILSAG